MLAYFCLALGLAKHGSCQRSQLEPKMFAKLIMPKIGIIHANINSVRSHRSLLAQVFLNCCSNLGGSYQSTCRSTCALQVFHCPLSCFNFPVRDTCSNIACVYQGISPDELKDELPERQPRYPSYAAAIWTYSLLEAVQNVGLHLFRPIIAVV